MNVNTRSMMRFAKQSAVREIRASIGNSYLDLLMGNCKECSLQLPLQKHVICNVIVHKNVE